MVDRIGVPELRDFRSLVRTWPHEAYALPIADGDEYHGIAVHNRKITMVYDAGRPLFMHQPERVFPRIEQWIHALRRDLGFPPKGRFLASTHMTRGGSSTALHCDHAISFVLQMSGEKIWHLAPNRSFPYPTQRYSLAMPGHPHGELLDIQAGPVPDRIPDGAERYHLHPGSVLFVPSGWWHAVEGPSESLALMFIGINVNWADVIGHALRVLLQGDERWRSLAVGGRSPNRRARADGAATLAPLLTELGQCIAKVDPFDLLTPRYLRASQVEVQIVGKRVDIRGGTHDVQLLMGVEELVALKHILACRGRFTDLELIDAGHPPLVVDGLLEVLVRVGLLELDP